MSNNVIPSLTLQNASFVHAQKKFFEQINWTVQKNENWIITGKIGSGKSSLVQALAGKYFLANGKLSYPNLEAQLPENISTYEIRRQAISTVTFKDDSRAFNPHSFFYSQRFNSFAADGTITVWEYLMEAGFSEYQKEHIDLVKRTGVYELLDLERIKLSSGQSRKLLITKSLLQNPKVLIIDNPYLGLDAKSRHSFNDLLDEIVKTKDLQLILSGQYDVLPKCISHELALENFKIIYEGKVRKDANNGMKVTKNLPHGKHFSLIRPEELENSKAATLIESKQKTLTKIKEYFKTPYQFEEWNLIFSLKDTSVAYYGKKVLDKINWQVKTGEKWALFGENGSGKSTLLALLFGDHPQAYANEIHLFDKKRGVGQNIWDIKKRTGFTSAELHYFFSAQLTTEQAIITGLFDHVYLKRKPKNKEQDLINLFMDYFDVLYLKNRSFQKLSTGEQRIILLIRALIKNPPLILLDEPFQGFDLATIQKAKHLINEILSPQHTLIFITHYQREIPEIVNKQFKL